MDAFESLFGPSDAFQIGSGLFPFSHVIDAAHLVTADEDLKTAVGHRARVQGHEDGAHIGKEAAVVVPIAVVLVPIPPASGSGLLHHELGVVVIKFSGIQKRLHRTRDLFAPGDGADDVLDGVIPKAKPTFSAVTVASSESVLGKFAIFIEAFANFRQFLSIKNSLNDYEPIK